MESGRPKTMTVVVDERAIKNAIPGDGHYCVIVRAIKNAHPELNHIRVDVSGVKATDTETGERLAWDLPREGKQMLLNFDKTKQGSTGKFILTGCRAVKRNIFRSKTVGQKKHSRKIKNHASGKPSMAGNRAERNFGLIGIAA